MHVLSALSPDLLHDNWFLQFLFTAFLVALGLLYLLKTTASKYFVVDANFDSSSSDTASPSPSSSSSSSFAGGSRFMSGVPDSIATSVAEGCAVCGKSPAKRCAGCKFVKYCSRACQSEHWTSDHKKKCDSLRAKRNTSVALVPSSASCKILKQVDKVLFPYDEFVRLYNWDRPGYRPCGLLNCGNSCFANVVLQCLAHTKPLVSYLLDKGHKRECRRNEWCFFCELETHMERAILSQHSFSPLNILSRLPSIGGNFGYGQQEDAHECMRFAIETMQTVCLDEHGGERAVHPKSQETTLVQHIFGGQLQSQVICTKCNQVSNQYENMMDLTVEIQGDATTLEECLDQFTAKESLHGENMYKCDGCNNYVKAWKRLSIHQGPNILTIALKRFQSGRFGKLNKRITFPESLDLSPYMSEEGDCADRYNLYAVVVHVDMLNASFFGHYICYTKDFEGNWYRIDDDKVARVELDEVLSQGAYMLLYSRVSARPTCLMTFKPRRKHQADVGKFVAKASDRLANQLVDSSNSIDRTNVIGDSNGLLMERNPSSSYSHQAEGEKLVAEANDSGAEQLGDSLNSSDPIKAIGDLEGLLLERNHESSNSHLQTEPSCTYDCRYVGDTEAHPTTYCNSTSPVSVVDGVHVNGEVSTDKSIAPDSPVGMVSCSFSSAYEVTYNEPPTSPVSVSVAASIYAENTSDKTQLFRTNELQDAGKLEEFECENELHMDRCIGTSEIVRSHQNDFSAKQNEVEFDDVLQKNHSTGISDAARRNQNDFSVTAMNGNCSDHPHLSNGDINVFVEGHLDSTSLMMQEPERCTDDMLIDGDEYRESVNLFNCEANVITLCGNAAANCQNDLSEMGNVELSRSGIDSYLSSFSRSYAHKDADKKLEI